MTESHTESFPTDPVKINPASKPDQSNPAK
jgi:hypothetical protein